MKNSLKLSSHGGLHLQISQAESGTTPTTFSPRSDARDTATRSPTHRSLPLQSTSDKDQQQPKRSFKILHGDPLALWMTDDEGGTSRRQMASRRFFNGIQYQT